MIVSRRASKDELSGGAPDSWLIDKEVQTCCIVMLSRAMKNLKSELLFLWRKDQNQVLKHLTLNFWMYK